VLSPLVLAAFLATWEACVRVFDIPNYILPSVSDVALALFRGLSAGPLARDGYWLHIWTTLSEILVGFVVGSLLGLALGVLISQSRLLELTLRPYIVAFQSLPKVAVAPIIVLWFGYGMGSKIITVSLLTFFPLLVTSLAGFKAVDNDRIDLMRALSASRWQVFTKIQLPSAAPYIFAGLDIAIVFAVVGAIVGEFVGAQTGLGVQIMQMNAALDVAGSFSVFIILSMIGLSLSQALRMIEKVVLFWSPSGSQRNSAVNV
jgi:NitT/TauT family transport system permease protein